MWPEQACTFAASESVRRCPGVQGHVDPAARWQPAPSTRAQRDGSRRAGRGRLLATGAHPGGSWSVAAVSRSMTTSAAGSECVPVPIVVGGYRDISGKFDRAASGSLGAGGQRAGSAPPPSFTRTWCRAGRRPARTMDAQDFCLARNTAVFCAWNSSSVRTPESRSFPRRSSRPMSTSIDSRVEPSVLAAAGTEISGGVD